MDPEEFNRWLALNAAQMRVSTAGTNLALLQNSLSLAQYTLLMTMRLTPPNSVAVATAQENVNRLTASVEKSQAEFNDANSTFRALFPPNSPKA